MWVPGYPARWVKQFAIHEDADVAVLYAPEASTTGQVFAAIDDELLEGGEYIGFGYPVEGAPDDRPVGRVLRGYFQRYMPYESSDGRSYFAAELSAPAPGGSSGTVLAYAHAPDQAVAIVTRNHDSWMTVERLEEMTVEGHTDRVEVRRVITYGVAAVLPRIRDWVDAIVDEMLRQAN